MNLNDLFNDYTPSLLEPDTHDSVFRWVTVTSVSPLQIQVDNTPGPLAAVPSTLVSDLRVGDRVWGQLLNRRIVILGRGGGDHPLPPVEGPRRSLSSTLTWGSVSGEFTIRSIGKLREIRGAVSGNLPVGTTAITNWWALPEADRPTINALGYCYLSGGFSGGFLARPDGQMAIVNQTGAGRNGIHQFTLVYSVD